MGAATQLISISLLLVALIIGFNVVNPPVLSAFAASAETKELTIVVPTYNEVPNIRPLTERIFKATRKAKLEVELLILDDESKGTEETIKIVDTLKGEGYNIQIHARKKSEGKGLSSAVLLGFEKASHNVVLCMDADLQHEPESVPDVAGPVMKGQADFTVGSRNVGGGGIGFEWSMVRRVISAGATALAMGLSTSTDPMSGFFCTTKEVLSRAKSQINPIGFKIGLELMVRCGATKVVDVPITFRNREAGESKLSMKQNILYVQQLLALYYGVYGIQFPVVVLLLIVFALGVLGALLSLVMPSAAKPHQA
jgi:dolichol-phosphate mannosyltransferase